MTPRPIRIAGAGLSGLAAAIGLAEAGFPVEVDDSGPESGHRRAGWDAVENWTTDADALRRLEDWGLPRGFNARPVHSFDVYDNRGDRQTVCTARPIFYMARRGREHGSLEQALKTRALEAGARIQYRRRRHAAEVDVWAAGARGGGRFLAAGLTFRTRLPDTVRVLISASHAPKAYAYLFVVDGQGVLSTTLTRDFAGARNYLGRCLDFFRRAGPLDMDDVRWVSGFGAQPAGLPGTGGPGLAVGEAAGLQDYLWGFGIRYALQSGWLAAQSLAGGAPYQAALDAQVRPHVYASLVNRAVYDRAGDRLYRSLIQAFSCSTDLAGLLRRCYGPSLLSRVYGRLARGARRPAGLKESET